MLLPQASEHEDQSYVSPQAVSETPTFPNTASNNLSGKCLIPLPPSVSGLTEPPDADRKVPEETVWEPGLSSTGTRRTCGTTESWGRCGMLWAGGPLEAEGRTVGL